MAPKARSPAFLERHVETVTALAFAPRGMRLASGARDAGVVVWSLGRDGQGDPIGAAPVADVVGALYWRAGWTRACRARRSGRDGLASERLLKHDRSRADCRAFAFVFSANPGPIRHPADKEGAP